MFFSVKLGVFGLLVACISFIVMLIAPRPVVPLLMYPMGFALSLAALGLLPSLFYRARAWLLTREGEEHRWCFKGTTVRGHLDDNNDLWISLTDCAYASQLELGTLLHTVSPRNKRTQFFKGCLLNQRGMEDLLKVAQIKLDMFETQRLRFFLEREVWRTPATRRN